MPFCATCGSSVEGKFCPKCGAAVAGGAAAPGASAGYPPPPPGSQPPPYGYQPPPPGYAPPPPPQSINASGIPSNIASMLCYLLPIICSIIFLVVEPYKSDRKVRFDAFQSLFLALACFAARIVVGIVVGMSYHLYMLYSLLSLAELAIFVFMAFKAYQNEKFIIPVIGQLADKQS